MLLSGHQPVYLPGIILFNKIALSDAFMFVGHVQYSRKSWQTRNRIRMGDKDLILSAPVKKSGNFGQAINETEFADDYWKRKHLGSIRQAYASRPYFDRYFPELESILSEGRATLGDLNVAVIKKILDWLGISTPILDSRELSIEGHKTDMLISMCGAAKADGYLSNEGARAYVDEAAMAEAGISHHWQIFKHPVYQQGSPFIENLSVIDLLFNMGPESGAVVASCGHIDPAYPGAPA